MPVRSRRLSADAETLLWQSRTRATVVVAIVLGWIAFRWRGLDSPRGSIASAGFEPAVVLWTALGSVVAYLLITGVVHAWVAHRRLASTGLVLATLGMDVVLIFTATVLTTPLPYFERALLVSFFVLYFAQLYQGNFTAGVTALGIAVMYVILLATAAGVGMTLDWAQELWTLCLYMAGVLGMLMLHGHSTGRLERIVRLFERMEVGDFSEEYEVWRDERPDNFTIVGRAYNGMRAQLATIVLTDTLSGCINRRGFEEVLAREAAKSTRSGAPVALLSVDVDHFKQVNDSFGHLAGDIVIRELGALLRETARAGDAVARVGGEEFAVVAPGTGREGAAELAHRILDVVRDRSFGGITNGRQLTVSIGVVADDVIVEGMTEDLRARADEALYAAKRGGRNRVVIWSHGMRASSADADVPAEPPESTEPASAE